MSDVTGAGALDRLRQLSVLLGRDSDERLARHGLSSSRAPLLWVISATGPRTQRELAESLRVSARNVTGLVDALVADGFVSREPHPHDRRAILVTLTKAGKARVATIAREQAKLTETLFAGWDREELDSFTRGLDRVVQSLRV